MTKVCIIGGGSLGHVCAGVLSSQKETSVNILTRHPERWVSDISVTDLDGKIYQGHLDKISSTPEDVLKDRDIIFLCLPGFAIEEELEIIKPFVGDAVIGSIVSSTGFFFNAHRILGKGAKLFGFQRTPFIARTVEYGKSANLLGYKKEVAIAVENVPDSESFRTVIESLWITPCRLLNNYYEASLTNSNPILHTGRLYSMWKDWNGEVYDHNILFYKEWTDEASRTLIAMDEEFQTLLKALPVSEGAIPTLLDYYESHDEKSLTAKISSIAAFQNITSPMKESHGGWVPDFSSRYFTEDFPYGLRFIVELSAQKNIATPTLDNVYQWGSSKCI